VIILSEDLVAAPEATLRALCSALNISFDPGMLSWPAGPKPEIDGCWAPWWYAGTHASTGFGTTTTKINNENGSGDGGGDRKRNSNENNGVKFYDIEPSLRPLLEECRPIYEFLRKKALRPSYNTNNTPLSSLPSTPSPSIDTSIEISSGTHAHAIDPRNQNILIGIRDGVHNRFDLISRPEAKISVLDSGFMLGDGKSQILFFIILNSVC
jgi:branched-chain amino acid aminotransferase